MCDAEAIRLHLSEPADLSPEGQSRRRFLQYTLAGAAIAGTGVGLGLDDTFAAAPLGGDDRILVLVELFGGNDGLDTVAPVSSGRYRDLRGGIAVTEAEGLSIDGGLALHPKLSYLKQRYDQGHVAVVQGIGYESSSLSHFDSMAHWMGGQHGLRVGRRPANGWIGRYLDAQGASRHPLHGVAFDASIPLHMRGNEAKAVTLRTGPLPEFGTETSASWRRMYDALRGMTAGSSPFGSHADGLAESNVTALDIANDLAPAWQNPLPGSNFVDEMRQAARLINVDVGVRVVTVRAVGFDTHRQHKWDHGVALGNVDRGIELFFQELDNRFADRVAVMTFSEFGRRPQKNASAGTDHGAASVAFVVGNQVSGGLHGEYPSLSNLDSRGNLRPTVDFRDLYGTAAEAWLGVDGNDIVLGSFEGLRVFGAAPDGRAPARPAPVPAPGVQPDRRNDEVARPAPSPIARHGYVVLTESGQVHNFGKHATYGSPTGGGAVSVRRHPSDDGYWVAMSDGAIHSYGSAKDLGDLTGVSLNSPIVGMATTPSGEGIWLCGRDGGVFAFGDAGFHGSAGNLRLAAPIVGMAAHPRGGGYWLCGSDGGVFAFGNAGFHGSTGAMRLSSPVVGIAAQPSGNGYWLLAGDGGVFAFGDARFHGSLGRIRLNAPVVDMTATSTGKGYWLVGRDGGVFTFGDATYLGAPTETGLADSAVSISS